MRKLTFVLSFLAFLSGGKLALAETVSPYKIDFNSPISTSEHAFKVASNWGHVVSSWSDDSYGSIGYYVDYKWSSSKGRNGSGALEVGTQTAVGDGMYSGSTTDLLVTPKITGTSSIYVKQSSTDGTVKFYTVVQVGHSLKRDQQISVTLPQLSTDDWVKVDIPALSDEYLGIYGSNVILDDFEAASAEVTYVKALKIKSVTNKNPKVVDCNADGMFPFTCAVELQNTGDFDLNPGDEGYTLSVVDYRDTSTPCFVYPIDQQLAAGATATVQVSGLISCGSEVTSSRYDIYENISNTVSLSGIWVSPVPYKPILSVYQDGQKLEQGTAVPFGTANTVKEKTFVLHNDGAAPLSVSDITVPDGFATDISSFPLAVAAHSEQPVHVTLLNDKAGQFAGNVVVTALDAGVFTFSVSGTVLDKEKFYANFEDGKIPGGSYVEDGWAVRQRDLSTSDNAYMLCNSYAGTDDKFVTPLLRVAAGDKMTFDAARGNYNSDGDDVYLNVYYSTDRTNWTLARTISASELSAERASSSYNYGALTNFTVDNIPAGEYYLGFGAGKTCIDNIYGFDTVSVAHDLQFTTCKFPATGEVNSESQATVKIRNINGTDEEAGSYTLSLYVDNEVVAQAEPSVIPAGGETEFKLTFVPSTAGEHTIYAALKSNDGYTVTSDRSGLTVAEEQHNTLVQVGSGTHNTNRVPLYWYNADNEQGTYCDMIYGQAMLRQYGIKQGDAITAITFKGTCNGSKDFDSVTLEAYVGMTDSAAVVPGEGLDNLQHIKIYDGDELSLKRGDELVTTISLGEPVIWDGTSAIRVHTYLNGSRRYCNVSYFYDDLYTSAYYKKGTESTFSTEHVPVAYFSIKSEATSVSHIPSNVTSTPATLFNMQGQRVSAAWKGIVIKNGRKYIQR